MASHTAVTTGTSATTSLTTGTLTGGPYDDHFTLILIVLCSSDATPPVPEAGWTLIRDAVLGSSGAWLYGRKGDATLNSSTMTLPGTATYRAWLFAYPEQWSDQLFEISPTGVTGVGVTTAASGTMTPVDLSFAIGALQLSGSAGSVVAWTNSWADVGTSPGGLSSDSFSVKDRISAAGGSVLATSLSWLTARNARAVFAALSRRKPVATRLKRRSGTATFTTTFSESTPLTITSGLVAYVRRESTTPIATPAGWTLWPSASAGTGHRIWVYYRRGDGTANSFLATLPDAAQTEVVLTSHIVAQANFIKAVNFNDSVSGTSHTPTQRVTSEPNTIIATFLSLEDVPGSPIALTGTSQQQLYGYSPTSEIAYSDRAVVALGTTVAPSAAWTTARTARSALVEISTKGVVGTHFFQYNVATGVRTKLFTRSVVRP